MRLSLPRGFLLGGLCSLTLTAQAPLSAQTSRPTGSPQQRAIQPGKDKVKKLYGLKWHSRLDGALAKAQKTSRGRRTQPVFWLRMLGDLAGKT